MNKLRVFTAVMLMLATPSLQADEPIGNFAQPHPYLETMVVHQASLNEASAEHADGLYFNQPIPRVIHQIWMGDPAIFDFDRSGGWQEVAKTFGYDYHLWTEDDDSTVETLFGPETLAYLQELRSKRHFDAASDVLRYHLVEHFGGMYFDLDVKAPTYHGKLLDPHNLWPARGLVLAGESENREVGNSAFYAQNHIMMAPPHHPVMIALTESLLPNKKAQKPIYDRWDNGTIHITGQSLLTATLRGHLTFITTGYLQALGTDCWPDVGLYRRHLREAFALRLDKPSHIASIHTLYHAEGGSSTH